MENTTLEKTLDMANSVAKVAANLSEPRKDKKPDTYNHKDDNSNKAQTGSQSVIVAVDKKKEPKPVEKHIHEFPETRALTSEECELALKKAQMEYELKRREQDILTKEADREWQHKLEVEKKNERKGLIRRIVACVLGAAAVGGVGYSIYTDYRDHKAGATVPALPPASTEPVKTESTVN